jgi:hypothetical protein
VDASGTYVAEVKTVTGSPSDVFQFRLGIANRSVSVLTILRVAASHTSVPVLTLTAARYLPFGLYLTPTAPVPS